MSQTDRTSKLGRRDKNNVKLTAMSIACGILERKKKNVRAPIPNAALKFIYVCYIQHFGAFARHRRWPVHRLEVQRVLSQSSRPISKSFIAQNFITLTMLYTSGLN